MKDTASLHVHALHVFAACGLRAQMLHNAQNTLSPGRLHNKHTTAWHKSEITYLAPHLFASMVFVESEETICCPVIMGGRGGGNRKWEEQIKLGENGRSCPRTCSTSMSSCSKSADLINIPSDVSWLGLTYCLLLCVCVCARARACLCFQSVHSVFPV